MCVGTEETFTPEQVAAAQELVTMLEKNEAVSDYSRPSTVVVGPAFSSMDYKEKEVACRMLDILRQSKGFDEGFVIRDVMNNQVLGTYYTGSLDLK